MDTLEQMIESLAKEIKKNIKSLSGIKNIEQRKTQAEIIKLLCESMGVFFSAIAAVRPEYDDEYEDEFFEADYYDDDDEYDDYDEDRLEEDMKKVTPLKKKKKDRKNDSDDIPF